MDKQRLNQLRALLRRAWCKDPERYAVLNDPKTKRKSQSENKRLKWEHQCNPCKQWFPQKEIQIDHIEPCGAFYSEVELAIFVLRLFCSRDNLQKICTECHKIKNRYEREQRKLDKIDRDAIL